MYPPILNLLSALVLAVFALPQINGNHLEKRSDSSSNVASRCSCYLLNGISKQLCLANCHSAISQSMQAQSSGMPESSMSAEDCLKYGTALVVCAECGCKAYHALDDCQRRRRRQRQAHRQLAREEQEQHGQDQGDHFASVEYLEEEAVERRYRNEEDATLTDPPRPMEQMLYSQSDASASQDWKEEDEIVPFVISNRGSRRRGRHSSKH